MRDKNYYHRRRQQSLDKHADYYLTYAEQYKQPTAAAYDALEVELINILNGMQRAYDNQAWSMVRRFASAISIPITGVLGVRGHWEQLHTCLGQAITAAQTEGHQQNEAAFLHNAAILAQDTGDYETARQRYEQALEIKEALGDKAGLASSYHQLGWLAHNTGDYETARQRYEQ
ncbi:tetratricopeptide repeat protein, partial [Anaerolineales bacterium HSG24]|nr:tetratricopeptide repeat protein [Anaerolineales bacterium HSG24]